ncbi:MAG: serine/threonine-protein kinase, partial [Polyangiaceae bacterium]
MTSGLGSDVDGSSTDEERRAFYQHRVARAGLLGAALGGSFLSFRLVVDLIGAAYGRSEALAAVLHPSMLYHLGGVIGLLSMWVVCRRGALAPRRIELVETLGVVVSCASYSLMGTHIPHAGSPELIVTLALTHGLFARAIYVPSTARRTSLLALVVGVVHVVIVFRIWSDIPPRTLKLIAESFGRTEPGEVALFQTGAAGMWWLLTVAGTTAASHVIYGLREEVRDVRRLGQYELLDKLGEGGMGIVYRARHAMLQRPTAVKLLPPERVGEETLSRFEREVRLTAKLTHPNTITVFDYGRTLDGVFYYAMELLDDGATLADVVDAAGPLPPSRVTHVLLQVLGALTEAHAAGLIHRDIKPQNLMLCRRGGVDDVVKVLDF